MIASTQIANTEIFTFIAVENVKKSGILFNKIANFTGKLLQNYK